MKPGNLDQNINQLLLKCLEGNASENEMQVAWLWVNQSVDNKQYNENARDIWLSASLLHGMEENELDNFWNRIKDKTSKDIIEKAEEFDEPKRILPRLLKIAAIVLITFALGAVTGKFYFNNKVPSNDKEYYIVEAPRGAKSFLTLADGTKIWLNAGSKISYYRNYNKEDRNVFLEGEAFFEVAKNELIPFYVYSSGIIVKAIGTAFNVKAYPEEGIVETTLVEGSITVESLGKTGVKEQTLMRPNQKASFYKATKDMVIENQKEEGESLKRIPIPIPIKAKIERIELKKEIDTELYTSWKDKRWFFEKQRLEDFAIILERSYDIKVIFKDDELKNYRLTGSLQEENLEQVLQAIQFTIPMDFNVHHNEVTLKINTRLKDEYQKILKMKNN
jgi:ferric-dicitrate binding protein FerR (iron transport regulator)